MNQLEKGDIVAIKGRATEVEVQSVRKDGDHIIRFDYLDRSEASPMRRTAYPSELISILRKNTRNVLPPKAVHPSDHKEFVQPVVVVKKEEGYQPGGQAPTGPAIDTPPPPLTVGVAVGQAAIAEKSPAVVTRIKRAGKK